MRITIETYKDGFQRVTLRVPLHGEGYAEMSFYPETVPVVTIQEEVQAEIFLPSGVEIYDAKDHEALKHLPKLSVWRGKLPPARR
jgi:hypothetical protein